jgi:thiosulfate/3-mercaptopyruvate sulfurtransferase
MNRVHSIIDIVKKGRLDLLQEIFSDNPLHPVDEKDIHGKTGFLYAAQNNYIPILELLKEEGADINVIDIYGNNALGLAIGCGSYEAAKYLLNLGADANSTFNGQPIIHIVILAEDIDMLSVLLDKDADPTVSNYQGLDCQQMAKRCLDSVKYERFNELLIEHGWI